MILPIGLFIIFLLNFVRIGCLMIWHERWLEYKYSQLSTGGFRRYHLAKTFFVIFRAVCLLLSLKYLYWPYIWGSFAVMMLLLSPLVLWAMSRAETSLEHNATGQIPETWRQKEQQRFRREIPSTLIVVGIHGLSWSKTFPFVPLTLTPSQDMLFSLLFGLMIVVWAIFRAREAYYKRSTENSVAKRHHKSPQFATVEGIPKLIQQLMNANASEAFAIVNIHGTDHFVQFSGDSQVVQMDFPMATDQQQQLRSRIEDVCHALGLSLVVNTGTDGTEFLDYDIMGEPELVTEIIQRTVIQVFQLEESSRLTFEREGF